MLLWAGVFALILLLTTIYTNNLCAVKECRDIATAQKRIFKKQKGGVLFVLVILCLLSGLRYETGGTDYFVYQGVYERLPTLGEFFANFRNLEQYTVFGHERLWLLIQSFFKTMHLSYNGFLFLHSVFFFTCFYFFLKRYGTNPMYCILAFLCLMYFYNTMVSMRQSTVIGLFLLSMPLLEKKRYYRYYFVVLISFFIHYSSLYLLTVPFINSVIPKTKNTLKWILLLSVPAVIISFQVNIGARIVLLLEPIARAFFGDMFGDKFLNLANSSEEISIIHSLLYFFIVALFILFFDEVKGNGRFFDLTFTMIICLFPILVVFRGFGIFTRLKDFFYLFYSIFLGMLMLIRGQRYKWLVLSSSALIYGAIYFRYILLFDGGHFMHYKSILCRNR